jgi:hypothetical protein
MDLKIPAALRNVKERKNAGLIRDILQTLLEQQVIITNQSFTSYEITLVVLANDLQKHWKPMDRRSLTSAVGDAIGINGLGLKKSSARRYLMPLKLPVMNGDTVVEPAVYDPNVLDPHHELKQQLIFEGMDALGLIENPFEGFEADPELKELITRLREDKHEPPNQN